MIALAELSKTRMRSLIRPIPRYAVVAAFCAALHMAIMIGLDALGVHYVLCQIASAVVLVPIGYWLTSGPVFNAPRSWPSFARYSGAILTNFPLQLALVWLLKGIMGLPMAVVAPVTTVILVLWNYLTSYWALALRSKPIDE